MTARIPLILSTVLLATTVACDVDSSDDGLAEIQGSEFRAFAFWSDVECDQYGDGCFARHAGSADLWTPVIDSCELAAMGLTPMRVDGWDIHSCDYGGVPTEAPDIQCFWMPNGTNTICFAGGDGWYAYARPACEDEFDFSLSSWPTGSCAAGPFGSHGYDTVEASSQLYNENYALGILEDEAYHLRPGCWMDVAGFTMVQAEANECFTVGG